ncbi:MAG: glucose-1-phosphate adenylyltransferase [Elusimicrobia bacterium]|nr:glucose-1-phosphate adenylyltransferase [Elusimicrobiota bacterium]
MAETHHVLTLVLAGGRGERLGPLTAVRAKPAVPFGGAYRLIDVTLSNCVNSDLRRILVLTQYMAHSLNRHIREAWRFLSRPTLGEFIESIPAQLRDGSDWYRGTADAVYHNLRYLDREQPDLVLILAGDHIYKMDYRTMLDYHRRTGADMVVGAVEVPRAKASGFGILAIDAEQKAVAFEEKPADPAPMPGSPELSLASMGIYSFTPDCLIRVLREASEDPASTHDFGRDIVWRMMKSCRVQAFPFVDLNRKAAKYWRDVGTVDAFWEANMDFVAVDPEFNLYDRSWPIYTAPIQAPPPKFVFADEWPGGRLGVAMDSLVSAGCIVSGGRVKCSILSPNVRVESHARVEESVLFDGVEVGPGAVVRRAIVDKGVRIPAGARIGVDPVEDRRRFWVSPRGIVVIPKGATLAAG